MENEDKNEVTKEDDSQQDTGAEWRRQILLDWSARNDSQEEEKGMKRNQRHD